MSRTIPQRVLDRIWDRVDVRGEAECWDWLLSINPGGYGQVGWSENGKNYMVGAHRAAWTAVHGPIPGDLTVDHLCFRRACCNPHHLRLLTNAENAGNNGMRRRTHCPQGHPYDDENTMLVRSKKGTFRQCRICLRTRVNARYVRRPAKRTTCAVCDRPLPVGGRSDRLFCGKSCGAKAKGTRRLARSAS